MYIETFSSIVWTAALVGAVISIYLARRHRQLRMKRLQILELLKGYFQGDMPADQLGQRTREITGRGFMHSTEFYSLAVAAFQRAMDAKLADQSHSWEDKRKLLGLFAALKNKFGLTDLFLVEAWRAGANRKRQINSNCFRSPVRQNRYHRTTVVIANSSRALSKNHYP